MEDSLIAAGLAQEVTDSDGEVMVFPIDNVYIDHIGPIPAQIDINGNVLGPGDNRWHTNIRVLVELTTEQVAALPTFDPLPTIPYRVFA